MTNGETVLAHYKVCLTALQDFYDSLIETKCPNPQLVSRVSESLVNIESLPQYLIRLKFHK